MERGLKTVLLFFVAFPLFGGVAMAAVLLVTALLLPVAWLFAVLAVPYAYAMAYGAAGLAGLGFGLMESSFSSVRSQPRRIMLGAVCGGGAVWLDFPSGDTLVYFAMPALGAASGALCGHLSGLIPTSGRSVRDFAASASGFAMLTFGLAMVGLWSYRMVIFHAVI